MDLSKVSKRSRLPLNSQLKDPIDTLNRNILGDNVPIEVVGDLDNYGVPSVDLISQKLVTESDKISTSEPIDSMSNTHAFKSQIPSAGQTLTDNLRKSFQTYIKVNPNPNRRTARIE